MVQALGTETSKPMAAPQVSCQELSVVSLDRPRPLFTAVCSVHCQCRATDGTVARYRTSSGSQCDQPAKHGGLEDGFSGCSGLHM